MLVQGRFDIAQLAQGGADAFLGLLTGANIAHETDKAPVACDLHFGHSQVEREPGPILPLSGDFAADPDNSCFARTMVPVEILIMLMAIGCGHEEADISANDFSSRVAEHFFGREIERFNKPALINRNDAFHSIVQDRAQLLPGPILRNRAGPARLGVGPA